MLPIAKREYELSSGEVISVGVNFKALEIMSRFPGGLNKLQKDMIALEKADFDSDECGEMLSVALDAMAYMLHALILAGGTKCTQEEAMMAIGPDDFDKLNAIFTEFSEAMSSVTTKNSMGRMMNAI